jgi:very-short-patch-repair endonuclease
MPEPREPDPARWGLVHAPPADGLAALADCQHGVVARRQLLDAGVSGSMVDRWIERRRILPLHRGVYAVGHRRLRREGHWLAAVLAAGPGAALSHREAAALHGLRAAARTTVDVTVAAQRRVAGVQVHRARLDRADVTEVDAIPVTTIARTLVDLADVVAPHALRKALDEAERSNRLDVPGIEAVLRRTRGRNGMGHASVRAALSELARTGTTLTLSELEDRFVALLDAHRIARPATNVLVEGYLVDACWPHARVVVELDGYGAHSGRRAFQDDRTRANDLQVRGYVVLRFTHDDVVRRPAETAGRIARALLGQAAAATG